MLCPDCLCEFRGWSGRCPTCGELLLDDRPAGYPTSASITYPELLERVRQLGGTLSISTRTTVVERDSISGHLCFGFGFAWACEFHGHAADLSLDLAVTEIGRDRDRRFPWKGYGFAWEAAMQGTLAGHALSLQATRVKVERRWRFPYFGFGYAWAEEMTGNCGASLEVKLNATEVGRRRHRRFPYRGFGYAWLKTSHVIIGLTSPTAG